MKRLRPGLQHCLLALLVPIAQADSIAELQASGELLIDSAVTPRDALVPGQKGALTLTIATSRWFAGGTRISVPEVPGLVILQTEQFASNATENRRGQSWVVQRWTLDVFPQRAGDFTIPPIRLSVNVNTEAGNVAGELLSPATGLSVILPASLAQAQHWVAAPAFKVSQSFDRPLENLRAGDAFEREVVFEADDVMAMMLPAFTAESLPGLAIYPAPPVLDNSNNRGQASARRRQRISYVVQQEGEYLLPAQEFFWWDTQAAQLRLLTLPATVITAAPGAAVAPDSEDYATARHAIVAASALALLFGIIWLVRRGMSRLPVSRLTRPLAAAWDTLCDLRRPALPQRLNPDNSAAD